MADVKKAKTPQEFFGASVLRARCRPVARVAGALAMLPGGLGVTEAGMAGSLQVLGHGITPSIATGATLLVRLATLWWAVIVGALALISLRSFRALRGDQNTP